ncbi:MAG: hypothetical protein KIS96_05490 [Bauldia sp.]|nr:hypothetical protein [Bauldia sp.]
MSTPLDLAVDIAGTLTRFRAGGGTLDAAKIAADISQRHPGTGYSHDDIAGTVAEEGRRAGLLVHNRNPRRP